MQEVWLAQRSAILVEAARLYFSQCGWRQGTPHSQWTFDTWLSLGYHWPKQEICFCT